MKWKRDGHFHFLIWRWCHLTAKSLDYTYILLIRRSCVASSTRSSLSPFQANTVKPAVIKLNSLTSGFGPFWLCILRRSIARLIRINIMDLNPHFQTVSTGFMTFRFPFLTCITVGHFISTFDFWCVPFKSWPPNNVSGVRTPVSCTESWWLKLFRPMMA